MKTRLLSPVGSSRCWPSAHSAAPPGTKLPAWLTFSLYSGGCGDKARVAKVEGDVEGETQAPNSWLCLSLQSKETVMKVMLQGHVRDCRGLAS